MESKGFTHLHLHTQYSLLDGAISPAKLFEHCKTAGMDSVAITDHGNMFGAIDFYSRAKSAGIKPIIGIEAYVAPKSRFDKQKTTISDASHHLILLAENNAGYHNLLKLASAGYTEGFYYRPRIDKEILAEYSEGLICLSGCLKGEVASCLGRQDEQAAVAAAEEYLKIFGDQRYFIELQEHENCDVPFVRNAIIELADKLGVALAATNDCHFISEDDWEAHDALTCISTGKRVADENRMKYPKDVFVKSAEQMRQQFADVESACDNTLHIAERCNVEIDLKSQHSPKFAPPDGSKAEDYLTKLVYDGAKKRYGKITDEIKERIDRELEVIEGKGFSSYFLIVWDFCRYAAQNNIPTGARGSGVGTIVGYCLGLCNVDPIKYDLLFERFMDPQRNEMPDIDIDICQDGRAKIIDYVRQRYGQVAQIITFGTMKARAVIRDVCRVLDVPLSEADRLAKLVPPTLGMTLDDALNTEPALKNDYETDSKTKSVIDIGRKLEGLTRHASVHAAGVVIADEELTNFLPLYKASGSDDLITQFEGPTVEKVGLLKMDFLGLRTLSVIQRTVELVKSLHNKDIDIEKIDYSDPKVFEIFASGRTKGIFQFESGGMQELLMKLKPDRLEDLIAANALYRPGPMALIGDFTDRKHGAKWSVPHPIMEEVLVETFGIMVYQEQVMRICNRLGDIPLRSAYTLIKAISKKKSKLIAAEKQRFIDGSVAKGLTESQAVEIFDLIEKFAGYGFNKSHATRYSVIAYQTAYLKAYWPVEFMAALLTYEMGTTDKVVDYIGECKAMDIDILPPDINESFTDFTVVYEEQHEHKKDSGFIRFGLGAVKGVGEKAVDAIIAARQEVGRFHSLFHFCENTDMRAVNRQVIDALIKAGAFDKLGGTRAQMAAGLDKAMQIGTTSQRDKSSGQMNLFGGGGEDSFEADSEQLPNVAAWSEKELLFFEKDVLGFYVTSNPLSRHGETIEAYSNSDTAKLHDYSGKEVVIGGMITKIRHIVTKNGRNAGAKMAVFVLEDLKGNCEVVAFPETLAQFCELVEVDNVVFVRGKVDTAREVPNIICSEIIDIDEAAKKLAATVKINLPEDVITPEKVGRIKNLCGHFKGKSPLSIEVITDEGKKIMLRTQRDFFVRPDVDFCKRMREVVGAENFKLG